MKLVVRCSCNVQRKLDTEKVGPWRLRCKRCGDVLYDPQVAPLPAEVMDSQPDSNFTRWLAESRELNVLSSTDGLGRPEACVRHPKQRAVAACGFCAKLLCRFCLDRVEEYFVCAGCVDRAMNGGRGAHDSSGALGWIRKFFGRP